MTSHSIEGACAFAWRNYLLRHSNVSENDNRRFALYDYVATLRERRFDFLQIAAVAYLKKLDELHDDRDARHAADEALAACLRSGRAR